MVAASSINMTGLSGRNRSRDSGSIFPAHVMVSKGIRHDDFVIIGSITRFICNSHAAPILDETNMIFSLLLDCLHIVFSSSRLVLGDFQYF